MSIRKQQRKLVRGIITLRHYHPPPWVNVGVWENGEFKGVVVFSRGASSNIGAPYGLKQTEICELTRVALKKHNAAVTKIIKVALILLRKQCPGIRLIVSYADPNQGHHGGIYQGGNWLYAGRTASTKKYIFRGKVMHSRQVSSKGINKQFGQKRITPKPNDCEIINEIGKFRYLMPLDIEMKDKIEGLRKKCPSRVDSVTVARKASSLAVTV